MKSHKLLLILFFVAFAIVLALPGYSYLPMFTKSGATAQMDHWNLNAFPVTYAVNPTVGNNFVGGASPSQIIDASFATWKNAPNVALQVSRDPDTTKTNAAFDGVNLICFVCKDSSSFGDGTDTLAVTITTTADGPGQDTKHGTTSSGAGQIIDADILFNPAVQWSTDSNVVSNLQDMQTVATHEIGHFFGLDHSAVVRAIMYPFAPSVLTTLSYDDVAGMSQLYPKASPDFPTGTLNGTVHYASGAGVFGAHVFADSNTGQISFGPGVRKSPIGTLTRPDGTYSIAGVPPDSYTITVEPLDDPVTNGYVQDYPSEFGQPSVKKDFGTKSH